MKEPRPSPSLPQLPTTDLFALALSFGGAGKENGRIVTLGGLRHVVLNSAYGALHLLPLDRPGPLLAVLAGEASRTSSRLAGADLFNVVVDRLRQEECDAWLALCLAGHAMSLNTPAGWNAAGWFTAAIADTPSGQVLDYGQFARILRRLLGDAKGLPPGIAWAADRPCGRAPLTAQDIDQSMPGFINEAKHAREAGAAILEEIGPALLDHWENPPRIPRFTCMTEILSGRDVLVVGEFYPGQLLVIRINEDGGIDPDSAKVAVASQVMPLAEGRSPPWTVETPESLAATAMAALHCYDIGAAWLLHDVELDYPSWDFALAAGLALHYRLRCSGGEVQGQPKAILKALLARYKACDQTQQRRLVAVAPELVNPALRRPAALKTKDARVHEALGELCAEGIRMTAQQVRGTPPKVAETPEPAPPVPAEASTARPSAPKQPRPLRAPQTNTDLLALEWALPADDGFDLAIRATLAWLGERLGTPLPSQWAEGVHEIEQGAVRLQVAARGRLFAFRLEHPDSRFGRRTWRLETTIIRGQTGSMAGLRLSTLDRANLPAPTRTVPGLVGILAQAPGMHVAEGVPARVPIDGMMALFRFRNDVRDRDRAHAIWVIGEDEAQALENCPPLVQVCALEADAAAEYASRFGPIAPGSWHAFPPGRAEAHVRRTDEAGQEIERLLAATSLANSQGPRFGDVLDAMNAAAARRRQAPAGESGPAEPATDGSDEAFDENSRVEDLQRQRDEAIAEQQSVRDAFEAERLATSRLKDQVRKLKERVRWTGDDASVNGGPERPPDTLAGISDWADSVAPRVIFAEKALKAAARFDHATPELVYATVQALHDHYWPMRWSNDPKAKERWDAFLAKHRMRYGPTGVAPTNHRFADAYKAIIDGRRLTLDLHVQGRSVRDPRRCLRIYFTADEERQILGIGSLPAHLDSTLS